MEPLLLGEPAAILVALKWDWWNLVFIVIVLGLLIAAFYFRSREVNGSGAAGAAGGQAGKGLRGDR